RSHARPQIEVLQLARLHPLQRGSLRWQSAERQLARTLSQHADVVPVVRRGRPPPHGEELAAEIEPRLLLPLADRTLLDRLARLDVPARELPLLRVASLEHQHASGVDRLQSDARDHRRISVARQLVVELSERQHRSCCQDRRSGHRNGQARECRSDDSLRELRTVPRFKLHVLLVYLRLHSRHEVVQTTFLRTWTRFASGSAAVRDEAESVVDYDKLAQLTSELGEASFELQRQLATEVERARRIVLQRADVVDVTLLAYQLALRLAIPLVAVDAGHRTCVASLALCFADERVDGELLSAQERLCGAVEDSERLEVRSAREASATTGSPPPVLIACLIGRVVAYVLHQSVPANGSACTRPSMS